VGVYEIEAIGLDGARRSLEEFRGCVLLVVNVASRCGFTPQYAGLEALYRTFKGKGFAVLGFPCDQFGGQEPGTEAEIQRFCRDTYDVTFPLFAKIEVNGPHAHRLYRWLKGEKRGVLGTSAIKWNFTKFLVDREGRVVARYGSRFPPERIAPAVRRLIGP
jgi:glutathione peroxidase